MEQQQQDPSTIPLPRTSIDSTRDYQPHHHSHSSSSISSTNGNLPGNVPLASLQIVDEEEQGNFLNQQGEHENGNGGLPEDRIRELEDELVRTRGEREQLDGQYRNLLGKLTTMRNTLGDKLKQDADELDRREAEINELRAANDDLSITVETLKTELIQSHEDGEHAHSELEQLRLRAFDSQKATTEEATSREMALRDAQEDLERVRLEREEWESEAMRERVRREELETRVSQLELELGTAKTEREVLREQRDREAESAGNLHAVLEEFQAAKDRELKSTLGDLQEQLRITNQSLLDFKGRASDAEARLAAAQNDSEKVLALSKEVKDKNLLVGKLRHEAVIMNEHLTEALRRLKKDSNENSVDRRLVSNVLITFLNTPRADTKRFEMLQLISSILSWSDDQREQVGLQRSSGISAPGIISSGVRRMSKGHARSGKGKAVEEDLGENESFSNLWIEFLLKEANQGGTPSSSLPASDPGSPTSNPSSPSGSQGRFDFPPILSPTLSASSTRRPSFTSFLSNGSASGTVPSTAPSSIKEEQ